MSGFGVEEEIGMKKLLPLLVFVFLIPNVLAQENEVCLVYFSGYACGDDCGLTDTFMDGLVNEYSQMLTAIRYYVDASQENTNLFEAYQNTYGLPSGVPLVLFGKGDYILGKNDIYANTESRILSFMVQSGTNCPLESGYVPPGEVNPDSLPGQADFFPSEGLDEEDQEGEGDQEGEEEGNGGETVPGGKELDIGSIIEDLPWFKDFNTLLIVAAVLIIVIFGVSLALLRRRVSAK